jgi:translation initiation factor 3 subunit B
MDRKAATHLFWSPRGGFIVLANCTQGAFEFVDTQDFTTMGSGDHHGAFQCEWDPTGRYVATGLSAYKVKDDHSYYIWSFQGRILRRVTIKSFLQLFWRPRPPTLLPDAQQKEIKKNLKKYYPQFEAKDRMRQTRASKELLEKRAKLRDEFMEYRQKRVLDYEKLKIKRLELRSRKLSASPLSVCLTHDTRLFAFFTFVLDVDTDNLDADENNLEEETVECLVKSEEVVLE